jgi:hypothetical protein
LLPVGISHPGHHTGGNCSRRLNWQTFFLPRREAPDDIRRARIAIEAAAGMPSAAVQLFLDGVKAYLA